MHPLSHRKRLRSAEKWTSVSPCPVVRSRQPLSVELGPGVMGRGLHSSTSLLNLSHFCH